MVSDRWIDWISGVIFSAQLFSGTHHDAVKLLADYAEGGIASPSLLRELLQEGVLNRFEVKFDVVLRLLTRRIVGVLEMYWVMTASTRSLVELGVAILAGSSIILPYLVKMSLEAAAAN